MTNHKSQQELIAIGRRLWRKDKPNEGTPTEYVGACIRQARKCHSYEQSVRNLADAVELLAEAVTAIVQLPAGDRMLDLGVYVRMGRKFWEETDGES